MGVDQGGFDVAAIGHKIYYSSEEAVCVVL